MATRFSAHAIEWWLKNLGKFNGAKIRTNETYQGSGLFEITQWEVCGIQQPSDYELEHILADYEAFKKSEDIWLEDPMRQIQETI